MYVLQIIKKNSFSRKEYAKVSLKNGETIASHKLNRNIGESIHEKSIIPFCF